VRLYLSSQDFGNHIDKLFELLGSGRKVAFINNAKDDLPAETRQSHTLGKRIEFEEKGLELEELNLKEYFNKSNKLAKKLEGYNLVWVAGGNTFILRRAMVASGFDQAIKGLLAEDKIVYGGSSAGSIAATPSLVGVETGDDPNIVPEGYPAGRTIWEGLNLVPYYIVPHYKSDWFTDEAEAMVNYMHTNRLPFYALMDGQVILVNGPQTGILK
jgi:dipeptidase E